MTKERKSIFKEWFDCKTDEETRERWIELKNKGYHGSEIYIATYQGKDGRFHREVFVFA